MKRFGEPVALAGAVVVLVNSVIAFLVVQGYWDLDKEGLAAAELIGTNVVAVVATLFARHVVTPTSDPKSSTGEALGPVSHP